MEIKDIMLKHEENYSKYATFDKESIRFKDYIPDMLVKVRFLLYQQMTMFQEEAYTFN